MTIDPHDAYGDPAIYDIVTSPGTAAEVEGLLTMAESTRPVGRSWRWLEPACGTGRYLRHLCRHGIDVWGFDASARMIRYAARHLPADLRRQLWVADFTAFADAPRLRSVDFAFNLNSSLRHLETDEAVQLHLAQMARCLRPGGLYAVGLDMVDGADPITEDIWRGERGTCKVTQVAQYVLSPAERSETVLSHLVIEREGRTEHRDHVYRLRTYRRDQWLPLVGDAGWSVTDVVDEQGRSMRSAPFAYGIYLLARVRSSPS